MARAAMALEEPHRLNESDNNSDAVPSKVGTVVPRFLSCFRALFTGSCEESQLPVSRGA